MNTIYESLGTVDTFTVLQQLTALD